MDASPPGREDRDGPPDREELSAQLDALEATLEELRGELAAENRGPPRPPSLGELLRFTEQYSIPTLIALLEAAIQSLELLRRTLRLADPARAARTEGAATRDRLDRVGAEAGEGLANALGELRAALSATELPENPDSRRLLEDARSLTDDIERRLREAEDTVRRQRETGRRRDRDDRRRDPGAYGPTQRADASRDGGVLIDVTERDEKSGDDGVDDTDRNDDRDATRAGDDGDDNPPSVDVDAELESIKDELGRSAAAATDVGSDTDDDNDSDTDSDDDVAGSS
ncbi:MAG: DUF7547 family protein [Haloferacaceae archaeon]